MGHTLYYNQTPGRSNVSSTRVCLVTAAEILLISPGNMQRTNAIVRRGKFPSVYHSCDRLYTSSLRALLYRASQQMLLCASKYILRLRVSPLTVDSLLNLRALSLTSRVFNHHDYLSNFVKINIYTSKCNLYFTITMDSSNEDSLHAPKPNANLTYICIYDRTIEKQSRHLRPN